MGEQNPLIFKYCLLIYNIVRLPKRLRRISESTTVPITLYSLLQSHSPFHFLSWQYCISASSTSRPSRTDFAPSPVNVDKLRLDDARQSF